MSVQREITDANFQNEVLNSVQPVLVDFWAAWCAPCRVIGPTIEELANQFKGSVTVGKINIDENPKMAAELGISSIPAVLLFKNGEIVETLVGVQPKENYETALERIFA